VATAAGTRQVFHRLGAASAELLQHFLKADPKGGLGARSLQTIARLRCRLSSTSKAAASRPLTAAQESA